MLDGFRYEKRKVSTGIQIAFRIGGAGPPLLLLHGYPQTHLMWAKIAPRLAEHFTVVMSDLRGYGDSDKPQSDPRHATYSFRAMAEDQVSLMETFGHRHFAVAGHDRDDREAGRKIQCPLLVLWGGANRVLRKFDMLGVWRKVSDNSVEGRALPCGHYLPEEVPQEVFKAFESFVKKSEFPD